MINLTHTQSIGLIIGIIFVVAIFWWADKMREEFEGCPKLLMGYDYCNRWKGRACNHSERELARARRSLQKP